MSIIFLFCLFAALTIYEVSSIQEDYYWRKYNGTIPRDAIVGGQSFGHNIYVGQAYIRNEGVFPVQINPGVKEVAVPIKGIKRVDNFVKILCGPQHHFEWVLANSTNLHVALLDRHAVIGGHEDNKGYIYIGRSNADGGIQIGKINAFNLGDANFHYADKNAEKSAKNYQVLCYADFGADLDIRLALPPTTPSPSKKN